MAFPPLPADDLEHVLAHTRDLWTEARGRRIFLTGGTGFFGPWLVETFAHANDQLKLGAQLVVLTRDPDGARRRLPHLARLSGVTLHGGDVRELEQPAGTFDFVIHGAAESSQQGHVGDHRHMFDTIVDGTRQTLGVARAAGALRYLLLSSGAVYGRQPADVSHVGEAYPGAPDLSDARSAYGEGKRAAEVLAAVEAEEWGLSVRVARCFAFVGPHLPLDIHFAIGNFIRDAMKGGPIRIRGDGTAVRSYLYMADLAIWLWTLVLHPSAAGAYNVGSEEPLSILQTARAVAGVCAPNAPIEVQTKPDAGAVPHRYVPGTARARAELGLVQRVEVRDAIERTYRWHSAVTSASSGATARGAHASG
jgi:nucleoside-diphosphate-sugar epimerase